MKNIRLLVPALCAALFFAHCGEAFAELPHSYKEFKARYRTEARTPEGALKLHFEAIFCYLDPATRAEGSKMVRYSMYYPKPIEQSYNLATFVERLKDPKQRHIFRSYAAGTSPENSYAMDPNDFELELIGKRLDSDGYTKIEISSSGADSPRRVWMKEHDGLWYTENNTAVYVQVREPKNILDAKKNLHDADYDDPADTAPAQTAPKRAPHDADEDEVFAPARNGDQKDDGADTVDTVDDGDDGEGSW